MASICTLVSYARSEEVGERTDLVRHDARRCRRDAVEVDELALASGRGIGRREGEGERLEAGRDFDGFRLARGGGFARFRGAGVGLSGVGGEVGGRGWSRKNLVEVPASRRVSEVRRDEFATYKTISHMPIPTKLRTLQT